MSRRTHPETGYRACLGVIRLADRYGADRVDAACVRAVAIGSPSFKTVKRVSIAPRSPSRQRARPSSTTTSAVPRTSTRRKAPRSGALFLFVNKSGNRLKAILWDRTGYCLLYKRLEHGVFRFPSALRPGDASVTIDSSEFAKNLEGLDVAKMKASIGVVLKKKSPETVSPSL